MQSNMQYDDLDKQQSCHQDAKEDDSSSMESIKDRLFSTKRQPARERLYTFKESRGDISTNVISRDLKKSSYSGEFYIGNCEPRDQSAGAKSSRIRRSPVFLSESQISDMEVPKIPIKDDIQKMVEMPDMLTSVANIPRLATDSVRNIEYFQKQERPVQSSIFGNRQEEVEY
jgi:hypothetical protein